jgi:hypothetical protein
VAGCPLLQFDDSPYVSAAVFLVLFLVAGMAFCFVMFLFVSVDRLLAPSQETEEERSILYGLRESVRDLVMTNRNKWPN